MEKDSESSENKIMLKRYQYYSNQGVQWTLWFKPHNNNKEKWQLKNKLKNEYK
jgi:hypothetical protein